jgi:tetratricopeptide (TPR) repeat protein
MFPRLIVITVMAVSVRATENCRIAADSLLAAGDRAYEAFDNARALQAYTDAYAREPGSYEALMKMVRACVDLAEDTRRKRNAEELLWTALAFADTLRMHFPDSVDAYFLVAVAGANLAFYCNGKEKLDLSERVIRAALHAIKLDPSHVPSHIIMGGYHRHVSLTSDLVKAIVRWRYGKELAGTLEESERYLVRAVALDAANMYAHLELAKTYLAMEDTARSHEHLRTVLRLPTTDHRHDELKEQARELLAE